MAHHEERPNVVLISVVAGLIGAGVALLFAPRSGRETRQKLRSSASNMKSHVKHQAQDNYEDLRNQAQNTMQSASEMKDKIAGAIKTRKNQAGQRLEDMSGDTSNRRQSSALNNWDEEI